MVIIGISFVYLSILTNTKPMGRSKNGIHGGISGKVGSIVYYERNGKNFVRSVPKKKKRKTTPAQEQAQRKFTFMHGYMSRLLSFIRLGFRINDRNIAAYNAAMSYNLHHAILIDSEDYKLDYTSFCISRGVSIPELSVACTIGTDHLELTWDYDTHRFPTYLASTYKSLVVGIDDQHEIEIIGHLLESHLNDGKTRITLPTHKIHYNYHIYLAFVAIDGSNASTNTVYVGNYSL